MKVENGKSVPVGGYPSVDDLPSVVVMRQQLRAFKLLTRLALWKHRAMITELERQLDEITRTVDAFYRQLGDRNWVFHDDLDLTLVGAMLATPQPVDEVEAQLIQGHAGGRRSVIRWGQSFPGGVLPWVFLRATTSPQGVKGVP